VIRSTGRAVASGLAGLFAITALLLVVFRTAEGHRAVLASAGVALVVQALCFVMVLNAPPRKLFFAWGATAALRLLTLVVYAFVLLGLLHLSPVPALISLAALFFVTTVLESLLLKP
jgi:hypothetical protein